MSDISEIKVIERTIEIVHPATKAPLGIDVVLMSPRDPRLDKLRKQISQQQISAQSKGRVEKVDELKARRHKILFAAIISWTWKGDANWKGEKPDLTPRIFGEIAEEAEWFIDQIDEAFGDLESFFTMPETI